MTGAVPNYDSIGLEEILMAIPSSNWHDFKVVIHNTTLSLALTLPFLKKQNKWHGDPVKTTTKLLR